MFSYDGDMTISLSSGLSIRVANDQFMVPAISFDTNGTRVENDTIMEFLFNGIGDQKATLGRYFLTAAYLMVNHDSQTFTMWAANPTTSSNLVSVVNQETETECSNITGVVQPSGNDTMSSNTSTTEDATTPVAAIAGGVVGGVIVIAIIGLGIFFFMRRRKRASLLSSNAPQSPLSLGETHVQQGGSTEQSQQPHQAPPIQQADQMQYGVKAERYELPPDYQPRPYEMMSNEAPVYYEMDGGRQT